MKKIYIHPLPIRIWHWVNAIGFVCLILTGLQIRYRDVLGLASFEGAVRLHNYLGFALIANFFIWLLYYLFSDRIKNYQADLHAGKYLVASVMQAVYYGYGIFLGKPNPFHSSPYNKFNPMQKMLYQIIMLLMVPLQFFSGLLLWDVKYFAGPVALLGGVRTVDTIHVLLFIFFAFFLPVHIYLASLGHTWSAHYKAMFTGYEEEEAEASAGH